MKLLREKSFEDGLALAEEATESKGATLLDWIQSDFLLQNLHSYIEALNLRGVMAPYFHCHHLWDGVLI